jgi:hypothetical protein
LALWSWTEKGIRIQSLMKPLLTFIAILLLMPPGQLLSEDAPPGRNDRATIVRLFEAVAENGGGVTIPPGDDMLDGVDPIPLASHVTVSTYGARQYFREWQQCIACDNVCSRR